MHCVSKFGNCIKIVSNCIKIMQHNSRKLGEVFVLISLSGWDSHEVNRMVTDNDLPLCHSEIETLVEFLSGVVKDGKADIITRKDRVNAWQLYGDNFPPGKLFIHPEK